jgi:probable F420-dependent oxidoreductase
MATGLGRLAVAGRTVEGRLRQGRPEQWKAASPGPAHAGGRSGEAVRPRLIYGRRRQVELGIQGLNGRAAVDPAEAVRLAQRAEQLGYRSWWAADHVVLPREPPDGQTEPAADPASPIVEPLVHLSFVAAVTRRMELATGVVILPQRHPLVLAKQAASLDVLSGGRFRLGIGAGWLEPELAALGVAMSERGARTDEYLAAMRALWSQPEPSYQGRYVTVSGIDAYPRPVRPDGVPIVVGGHSPAAFRRAVTAGHGWFGNGDGPADLERYLGGLAKAAADSTRPAGLARLQISFMPLGPVTPADARDYASLGADRLLIFGFPAATAAEAGQLLERHAELPR